MGMVKNEVASLERKVNQWFINHNLYDLYNQFPSEIELFKVKSGKGHAYMFYDSSDAGSIGIALVKCDDNDVVVRVIHYDEEYFIKFFDGNL